MGDWKPGDGGKRERQVSYVKALNNPVGPKQTKCNITEEVQVQDLQRSCVAIATTSTPDVPSGSSFQVMTKYCLMWAGGPATRILITSTIEWTKSSWLKPAIEKGANDGQFSFAKDIVGALRTKLEVGGLGERRKEAGNKRVAKRRREDKGEGNLQAPSERYGSQTQMTVQSIGRLLLQVMASVFSSTGVIAIILILVLYGLLRVERTINRISAGSMSESHEFSPVFQPSLDRGRLWSWIDTRVKNICEEERDGQLIWNNFAEQFGPSGIQEVQDAIRFTEGKLKALKRVVGSRNSAAS
jgi:VAD1 Analog of StAR-related lipid transfer domain